MAARVHAVRDRGVKQHAVRAYARRGGERAQVAEMQRARLLAAAVRTLAELGYSQASVAQITSRARVSRRTFYELFANVEECLDAVLADALGELERELQAAAPAELPWRERMRLGLWTILGFLDRQAVLARVCVVQAMRAGPAIAERRERVFASLAAAVDEGRGQTARVIALSPLTAEGLVGAAFQIVHARLTRDEHHPLSELHGELLGLILLPYLGPAAARREQARSTPGPLSRSAPGARQHDPLEDVPMRLTYRTARVLEGVAHEPGASNRQIADHAGIQDPGQVSRLLARLQRLGLLVNDSAGHSKGEPNSWTLTAKGARVAQSIRVDGAAGRRAA